MLTLDDVLPAPQFRERHACHIAAPPQAVWDALRDLRLRDLPLSRTLMGIRALPMRLGGAPPTEIVSGTFLEKGPLPVLSSEAPRAVLAGAAMRPWRLTGGYGGPCLDAAALRDFREPGYAKTAIDFVLTPDARGTWLTTETRITATDGRSRLLFGLYWAAIRAASGLIRRDMLREVARRAQV